MFRRTRNSKGEATATEAPVVAVNGGGGAREKVEKASSEHARSVATNRLKLNGDRPNQGQVAEVDGDAKRRRRLLTLRVDLHRKLLETLNLGAIEKVSEQELRHEIGEIVREELMGGDLVLNRAEFEQLVNDLVHEVTGLGPLEPLLAGETTPYEVAARIVRAATG